MRNYQKPGVVFVEIDPYISMIMMSSGFPYNKNASSINSFNVSSNKNLNQSGFDYESEGVFKKGTETIFSSDEFSLKDY